MLAATGLVSRTVLREQLFRLKPDLHRINVFHTLQQQRHVDTSYLMMMSVVHEPIVERSVGSTVLSSTRSYFRTLFFATRNNVHHASLTEWHTRILTKAFPTLPRTQPVTYNLRSLHLVYINNQLLPAPVHLLLIESQAIQAMSTEPMT